MSNPIPSVREQTETVGIPLELKIAEACQRPLTSTSLADIVERLQVQSPDLGLRYAMTRAGWHRLGGVVDVSHRRIAQHIGEWAEAQSDGDLDVLLAKCASVQGFATRLEGCTHYITAVTGDRAREFIQIEVEQVQEVIERPLWDPDWLPDDLEDFIDPLDFPRLAPEPVGAPRLLFRRLLRVPDFLDANDAGTNLKRFFNDWDRSSAGESACFCDHWVLSVREYRDAYREDHLSAKPVALASGEVPELPDEVVARGAALANLIHGFDRQAGYHFAWYFHMLTRRQVSYRLAEAVHADQMGAFDYLPARDLTVLRDWYEAPYGL
jgi:hypothetical protein